MLPFIPLHLPPQQEGDFFSGGVYDRGSVKPTRCPSFCFVTPPTRGGLFFIWRRLQWGQREIHTLPLVLLHYLPSQHLRQGQRETHMLPVVLLHYPHNKWGVFFSAVFVTGGSVKSTCCPFFCFVTPPTRTCTLLYLIFLYPPRTHFAH